MLVDLNSGGPLGLNILSLIFKKLLGAALNAILLSGEDFL
jgi:hypothetical protein